MLGIGQDVDGVAYRWLRYAFCRDLAEFGIDSHFESSLLRLWYTQKISLMGPNEV